MNEPSTSSRRDVWYLFLCLAVVNLLLMPADMLPVDPSGWFTEARTYVATGSIAVPEEVAAGLPPGLFLPNPRDGRLYSKYGSASSLAVLPPVWIAHVARLNERQELIAINAWQAMIAAGTGTMLYLVALGYTSRRWVAMLFVAACCYATFMWFYIRAQGTEIFQCLYFTTWFYALTRLRRGEAEASARRTRIALHAVIWICVLLLVHTRPVFVLMIPWTVLAIVMSVGGGLWHNRRAMLGRMVRPMLVGMLVLASWMAVNHLKFGSWKATGYHIAGNGGERASLSQLPSVANYLTDPTFSVFIAFPVLTLSLLGVRDFWKRDAYGYMLVGVQVASVALVAAAYGIVLGGWSEGPRYLLFGLPLLSLPFVYGVERLVSGSRTAKCVAAVGALLLLGSTFCWWQVISRPMFAWYGVTGFAMSVYDSDTARWVVVENRGLFLRSMWAGRDTLDDHPLMAHLRATLSPTVYAQHRARVVYYIKPGNFMFFPESRSAPARRD